MCLLQYTNKTTNVESKCTKDIHRNSLTSSSFDFQKIWSGDVFHEILCFRSIILACYKIIPNDLLTKKDDWFWKVLATKIVKGLFWMFCVIFGQNNDHGISSFRWHGYLLEQKYKSFRPWRAYTFLWTSILDMWKKDSYVRNFIKIHQ